MNTSGQKLLARVDGVRTWLVERLSGVVAIPTVNRLPGRS